MHIPINFNQEELERLYITYFQNPKNYKAIKVLVLGETEIPSLKEGLRGQMLFVISLSFVAMVSSLFSYFVNHVDSIGAIWLVWFIVFILFLAYAYLRYKTDFKVWQDNKQFFLDFEEASKQSPELSDFQQQDFYKNWLKKIKEA